MTDETGKKSSSTKEVYNKEGKNNNSTEERNKNKKKMREVKVYSPSQKLDDYYLFAWRMIVILYL